MKPKIGITCYMDTVSNVKYNMLSTFNTNAVLKAGGIPVIFPASSDDEIISNYLDIVDGVYFTGGEDISPILLNEEPSPYIGKLSYDRDIFEIKLFKEAAKRDIPILGVCRGMQLINIAAGGKNYQDIYKEHEGVSCHNPKADMQDYFHNVYLEKGSIISEIYKDFNNRLMVNSSHHQAVKIPAEGFKVTGRAKDNIIECIESIKNTFILATQWHPEYLQEKHEEGILIYKRFIQEAEKYAYRTRDV